MTHLQYPANILTLRKYKSSSLIAPRTLGLATAKGSTSSTYVLAGTYLIYLKEKNIILSPTHDMAETTQQTSLWKTQVKADETRTKLQLPKLSQRKRRHENLDANEKRNAKAQRKLIDTAKANMFSKNPVDKQNSWELLDELRDSQFDVIKCQATHLLGTHPVIGGWAKRRVFFGRGVEAGIGVGSGVSGGSECKEFPEGGEGWDEEESGWRGEGTGAAAWLGLGAGDLDIIILR